MIIRVNQHQLNLIHQSLEIWLEEKENQTRSHWAIIRTIEHMNPEPAEGETFDLDLTRRRAEDIRDSLIWGMRHDQMMAIEHPDFQLFDLIRMMISSMDDKEEGLAHDFTL